MRPFLLGKLRRNAILAHMIKPFALYIVVLLMPMFVLAQGLDSKIRHAETNANQAAAKTTNSGRRGAANRARRDLQEAKAGNAPFLGSTGGLTRQRIDRVDRQLSRLPKSGRDPVARPAAKSGTRTRLMKLGPREVTLDPSILDE